jgi:hypothetical protein
MPIQAISATSATTAHRTESSRPGRSTGRAGAWGAGDQLGLQQHVARRPRARGGDHHVARAGGEHVRHVEAARAAQHRRHALLEQQALDELGLGWLRAPPTRTRSPSLYCGLILRARAWRPEHRQVEVAAAGAYVSGMPHSRQKRSSAGCARRSAGRPSGSARGQHGFELDLRDSPVLDAVRAHAALASRAAGRR